jgi:hypothetical protein
MGSTKPLAIIDKLLPHLITEAKRGKLFKGLALLADKALLLP